MKTKFIAIAIAALIVCSNAAAQNCILPPGTVGIWIYCPKLKVSTVVMPAQKASGLDAGSKTIETLMTQAAPTKTSISAATATATGDSVRLGDGLTPTVVPSIEVSNPATAPVSVLTPVQVATLPDERLTIQAGQRLSFAVGAWLKSQNIELSWEPAGTLPGRIRDVVIDSAWKASQPALEPTLSEVLAPFGLTAHILRQGITTVSTSSTGPTSIVVRNTSNSQP